MTVTRVAAFSALAARTARAVDDGLNVVVSGHPGSGLHRVVLELHTQLGDERHVVTATGVKAWQQFPFSGLNLTRRGEGGADAAPPTQGLSGAAALRAAVDDLARAVGSTGVVLVSRPEWLDAPSVGVLNRVSHVTGARVVTVVDDGAIVTRRVPLLDELEPGLHLQVPLLSFDEVFRVAVDRLGGPVEAETVARLRAESGGLYGIVLAMLDVGRHSGALVQADGVWRAAREFASDDIASHIKHMLAGVSHAQVGILQAIAASNLDGEEFTPAPGTLDDLAMLVEGGLVRREGGRWELFPPILDERMRHNQRIFLRGRLARSTAGEAPADASLPLSGAAARGRGWGVSPDVETEAVAGQRIRTLNRAKAVQLRAAWEATRSAADALPLVVALQTSGAGRAEIAEVVSRTKRGPGAAEASEHGATDGHGAQSADYPVLLVWWSIYRELLLGESGAAVDELRQGQADFPAFAALFAAAITHLEMMLGAPVPDVATIADDPAADFGLGRVARLDAMLFGGATADALALADRAAGVRPVFAAQLVISGNIARMLDGSVESGLVDALAALERAESAGNLGLMQAHAYTVMLGLVLRGRLREARSFLDRTLALSTSRALHTPFQRGTIDLGVLVETFSVNPRAVQRLADIAATFPATAVPLPAMDSGASEAASALDDDRGRPLAIVADRLERGHVFSAAFLIMAVQRLPARAAVAEALRARTAESQSPLLRTIGDYVCAVTDGDVASVLKHADDFHRMGAEIFSVAARGHAAALYYDAGQKTAAVALAQETWDISDPLGDGRIGLLRPVAERIGLTEREAEAVLLGARGASNKAIADSLGLSQRTVENRWYAAYAKVGTSNRAELTRACQTWLRAASSDEGGG